MLVQGGSVISEQGVSIVLPNILAELSSSTDGNTSSFEASPDLSKTSAFGFRFTTGGGGGRGGGGGGEGTAAVTLPVGLVVT